MSKLLEKYLSVVKEILPQKTHMSSVGIDLGAYSFKAVELNQKGDTVEIANWLIEDIGPAGMGEALKKIIEKLKLDNKGINIAIAGQGTLIRHIDMPQMSLTDLKKSFEIEADKYFPFSNDQIFTDCFILSPKGKENMMSVLVAAAKKEIINHRLSLFSSVGLQPQLISMNAVALANAFNTFARLDLLKRNIPKDQAPLQATAVLDMGESICTLIILKGDLLWFTRDIFIGGRDLTKRISNTLDIGIPEAEKIKCQQGEKSSAIASACESILMNLISEIRLSFDYFVEENNMQISKLYLTGGSSLFEGVTDFFRKIIDVPVEMWNLTPLVRTPEGISREAASRNIVKLGVALGLALNRYD